MHPYIGVTGFMHRSEVKKALAILNAAEHAHGNIRRKLMVGVLACSPSLSQKPNRWLHRYPAEHHIRQLFLPDRRVLNTIHYNSDSAVNLSDRLKHLVDIGGPYLDGIQLNMTWPPPSQVYAQGTPITLELGKQALEVCNHDPEMLCYHLKQYGHDVKRVLLDTSAGHGIPLVTPYMQRFLEPIVECMPHLGIGLAGGLSRDRLDQVTPLLQAMPQLSIDAEGALRDTADHLDLVRMESYLERSFALFP
jgi:hypothetical protein